MDRDAWHAVVHEVAESDMTGDWIELNWSSRQRETKLPLPLELWEMSYKLFSKKRQKKT